jgi:serine/threonine protein kinase
MDASSDVVIVPSLGLHAKRVGRGTFASVFVGHDATGVRRAVKVAVSNRKGPTQLVREMRYLRDLRDAPCVVGVLGLSMLESGKVCLVLDDGRISLEEWLATACQRKRGSWRTRGARFAADIACALAHCHSRNIVHRDVKPQNIILRNGHALLIDFGCACRARSVQDMRVGTLAYRPPETVLGERICSTAVDVFALGLLIHEATTCTRILPLWVDSEFGQLIRVLRVFGTGARSDLDWARGLPEHSQAFPAPRVGRTRFLRFLSDEVRACCALDPRERCTAADAHEMLGFPAPARNELETADRELGIAAAGPGAGLLVSFLARATHRVCAAECAALAQAALRVASCADKPWQRGTVAERCAERTLLRLQM